MVLEIVDGKLHCTEIKHHDCTPKYNCPVAIEREQIARKVNTHTCIECNEFKYDDPYILEYGACGFCINELADNHSAITGD